MSYMIAYLALVGIFGGGFEKAQFVCIVNSSHPEERRLDWMG